MKIRCTRCRKKVSVDEAFAGEVCRCPYCKALIHVSSRGDDSDTFARPAAPTSGTGSGAQLSPPLVREAGPEGPPGGAGRGEAARHDYIPMAKPVRIQGIITIVLLVMIMGMVVMAIVIGVKWTRGEGDANGGAGPDDLNPFVVGGGNGGGDPNGDEPKPRPLEVEAPVIYCLDAGSSMRDTFDYALLMARVSILSLKSDQKFDILLCGEEADKELPGGFRNGGAEGDAAAKEFLNDVITQGATDISRALAAALARKPKTIVLYARKNVDDAVKVADRAKAQGVRIVTVALTGEEGIIKSMAKLAEITGGDSRAYSIAELDQWLRRAPPLE